MARFTKDLHAAGRGALAGLIAGPVFGIAHGVFLVWVLPPALFGAVLGVIGGALCGPALQRAPSRVSPARMGALLAGTILPLGVAAFVASPALGDPAWLAVGAALACTGTGAMLGRSMGAGWRGVVAFALVGLMVGALGEPFVHEGPEPRIVGFFAGLILALEVAGIAAAYWVPRPGFDVQ